MSRAALLARGRSAAEAGMVDACTVRRSTGTTTDDNTGEVVHTYDDVYSGKCKLQQSTANSGAETAGQDYQLHLRMELHLPISAPALEVADEVEMTAAALDPQLVGMRLVVRDLHGKTYATARRVGVTRRTQ